MRTLPGLALLALLSAPSQEDGDRLYIDQAPEEFLKRWDTAALARDWRKLLELHTVAHESFPTRLARPDPEGRRWLRLPAVLNLRLSALEMPDSARETYEAVARDLVATLQDAEARRRAAERYAFTRTGLSALEALGAQDFDEGRLREAIRAWSRALEIAPSPELVARLANAHAASGDFPALSALKARARLENWKGQVSVKGRPSSLGDFLDSIAPPPAGPLQKPAAAPQALCEVPLGRHEFRNEGGTWVRNSPWSVPAAGRNGEREIVIVTNGTKVSAIDPARASGGALTEALEWQFPREGQVRSYIPSTRSGPPYPSVGAAISGRRAFVSMFTQGWQNRHKQVGRRPDSFEGPAAIRAFDVGTGELLWDTETLEVPGVTEEQKVPLMDGLPFGRCNFCFAAPPLPRGDRVYAIVMTSPLTERECFMLCLDAATGRALWCTAVSSAPPFKDNMAVPSFAEEDGTIIVQTSMGVMAALDAATGTIEWLVKYVPVGLRRSVSAPVIRGSLVYALPQDREEPLVLDRWTGREEEFPKVDGDVWTRTQQLVGRAGDWLVLSGARSHAVRVTDGETVELLEADASPGARGAIAEGRLYLPVRGTLMVYDTSTWKLLAANKWTGGDEGCTLVPAGSRLLSVSDRLELWTSLESLQAEFRPRVEASPPNAVACRQLAQLLEAAGRPAEALPHYKRALGVWAADPAWHETSDLLRKKIQELEEKLAQPPPPEKER